MRVPRLDVATKASATTQGVALFVRQRKVKTTWIRRQGLDPEFVQQRPGTTFGRSRHAQQQQGAARDEIEQVIDLARTQVARIQIEHDGTVPGVGEVVVAEAQTVEYRVTLRAQGFFQGEQAIAPRRRAGRGSQLEWHLMEVCDKPIRDAGDQNQTECSNQ